MIMSKKGGFWCAVRGCRNATSNCKLSFFRFPKDPERSKNWIEACNRIDIIDKSTADLYKSYRVCSVHFTTSMFLNDLQNRLQPHAVPILSSILEPPNGKHILDPAPNPIPKRCKMDSNSAVSKNISESGANVCKICSQKISEDNRACSTNSQTSNTGVKRAICNECFGNLKGQSSKVKLEDVSIDLVEFNMDIPNIMDVPCQSGYFYCYFCGYPTIDETTIIEHLKIHRNNQVFIKDENWEDTKPVEFDMDIHKIIE